MADGGSTCLQQRVVLDFFWLGYYLSLNSLSNHLRGKETPFLEFDSFLLISHPMCTLFKGVYIWILDVAYCYEQFSLLWQATLLLNWEMLYANLWALFLKFLFHCQNHDLLFLKGCCNIFIWLYHLMQDFVITLKVLEDL